MHVLKHLPNTITSGNLLSGALGVIFTFKGEFETAFLLMMLAAVFDFFDGFAARLLKAYSPVGKELDSLADDISFGLLPSLMLYKLCSNLGAPLWVCLSPLLIAAFSALRLAKFNIDTRQSENFIGLATPAAAMICGSLCCLVSSSEPFFLHEWCSGCIFIPALTVVICFLLVSEIPMFSMKFKKDTPRKIKVQRAIFALCTVICIIATLALHIHWSFAVLSAFVCYVVINVLFSLRKETI